MKATRAYQAPPGITSINLGDEYTVDENGQIHFPETHDDSLLRAHGFVPVADEPVKEVKEAVAGIDDLHKADE